MSTFIYNIDKGAVCRRRISLIKVSWFIYGFAGCLRSGNNRSIITLKRFVIEVNFRYEPGSQVAPSDSPDCIIIARCGRGDGVQH